jgi:speckle-type POZ protein
MLLFIYTDKLPDVHEITGSTSMCTSTNMVQHLLAVSDLYNLDRLKLLCESKLCEELSAETVATTLALAEQHQCTQLKAICLKFAANPANLGGAFVGYERCKFKLYQFYCFALFDLDKNT